MLGTVLGAVAVVTIAYLVPWPAPVLVVLGVLALAAGFTVLNTHPVLGNAGAMFMTVSLNTVIRRVDVPTALLEYAGLILAAVVIGVVVGFLAVPGVKTPDLPPRLTTAVGAEQALLDQVVRALNADRGREQEVVRAFRNAHTTRLNLTADEPGPPADAATREIADQAARALDGLTTTMTALLDDRRLGAGWPRPWSGWPAGWTAMVHHVTTTVQNQTTTGQGPVSPTTNATCRSRPSRPARGRSATPYAGPGPDRGWQDG